jgi:hypothetical protein
VITPQLRYTLLGTYGSEAREAILKAIKRLVLFPRDVYLFVREGYRADMAYLDELQRRIDAAWAERPESWRPAK